MRKSLSADGNNMRLFALSEIAPGEELTYSYLSKQQLGLKNMERQELTASGWGFRCTCPRCIGPSVANEQTNDPQGPSETSVLSEGASTPNRNAVVVDRLVLAETADEGAEVGKSKGNKAKVPPKMQQTARFPMMTPEETASITVPFGQIDDRLVSIMAEHGTAIVTDVLSEAECARVDQEAAADLLELVDVEAAELVGGKVEEAVACLLAGEGMSAVSRATALTLGDLGRCQLRGLPHGRMSWSCRRHEKVLRCYEVLHGTDALVTSCDNAFFSPCSSVSAIENKVWGHVDHNSNDHRGLVDPDCDVYQGA